MQFTHGGHVFISQVVWCGRLFCEDKCWFIHHRPVYVIRKTQHHRSKLRRMQVLILTEETFFVLYHQAMIGL